MPVELSNPICDLFRFIDQDGIPGKMLVDGAFVDTVKVQIPSSVVAALRLLAEPAPHDGNAMRRISDLGLDEMRKALRDLQTWCYLDGEFWRKDREIGGTDTVDCLLGVLDDLKIVPAEGDEETLADPVEYKDYL